MRNESQHDPLLNAQQVAKVLNVSKTFVYTLMRKGEIPTVKILGARRVRSEDLSQYIKGSVTN